MLRYYAKYKEFLEERDGRLQYAAAIAAQSAASATSANAPQQLYSMSTKFEVGGGAGGKHGNESSRRRSSLTSNRLMVGANNSHSGGSNLANFLKFERGGGGQHDIPAASSPRNKARLDDWLEDDSDEDLKMSAIPSLFWRPKVSIHRSV